MTDGSGTRTFSPGNPTCMIAGGGNPYLPRPAVVRAVVEENSLVRTLELVLADEIDNGSFTYQPGQFLMLSLPHCGEAPFTFSSSPARPGSFTLTIRRVGKLTEAAHLLRPGDTVGVRGPYGRPFPMAELAGKDLLFIAGGIGMAPLRSVLATCIADRPRYGGITLCYGCRQPGEFCFNEELCTWQEQGVLRLLRTVDQGDGGWQERVGLVTGLLDEVTLRPGSCKALVCGPGIMIRFVIARLLERGMEAGDIITTLERQMKCGIGLCGHCHFEEHLVCADGPVFLGSELPGLEKL